MKHNIKITLILIGLFIIAQLIGIAVISFYTPQVESAIVNGTLTNITTYNLPYGTSPPPETNPQINLFSIIIAIFIAAGLMFVLMKFKAEFFLRLWFFFVVALAIAVTLNAALSFLMYSSAIALVFGLALSSIKVYQRNIFVHNLTEPLIYPGVAAILVPLFNVWTVIILLIVISIYDMYAVWHAGFMQKMAKYQIEKLRFFTGLFIPYLGKNDRKLSANKSKKGKKVKVSVAILGGGDIVFPIILAGVVLLTFGLVQALIVSLGATIGLISLLYLSEKGKFYPAMPFITAGCFAALIINHFIF
ncbi:MAG: presenilin family intramembrane aspartyl protease [archaeon]